MSSDASPSTPSFRDLGLPQPVLAVLDQVGYEVPSPIQVGTIPPLLDGRDVIGQAQTGTGKTAAFALPLLTRIHPGKRRPQVLVLTPTRELAIQVAQAFQDYAVRLKNIRTTAIYGGQMIDTQIERLRRGIHVVVGTPGRVMDHIRRKTLQLDNLMTLVLDEADEMLRMGFIDDVEWILSHTPPTRQTALFSATMPDAVRSIAERHLRNPQEVRIETRMTAAETVRQRYWEVKGVHKLDALTRILEAEPYDAVLVFVRTRMATAHIAEKLQERGYPVAPLSGDIAQKQRERTVERLKRGQLDIIIATDVAARGLDVNRISHVVNYDVPHDTEAFIHRIGRTGRAGRSGDAILFVAARERRIVPAIESAIGRKIERMNLPSRRDVNDRRVARFKERLGEVMSRADLSLFQRILSEHQAETGADPLEMAAALATMNFEKRPFLLAEEPDVRAKGNKKTKKTNTTSTAPQRAAGGHGPSTSAREAGGNVVAHVHASPADVIETPPNLPAPGKERYRVAVGRSHKIQPGRLVAAIANQTGLEGRHIGPIEIHEFFSTVDLPAGLPRPLLHLLSETTLGGKGLKVKRIGSDGKTGRRPDKRSKRSANEGTPFRKGARKSGLKGKKKTKAKKGFEPKRNKKRPE